MLTVSAGRLRAETSQGVELHTDVSLSKVQADLVLSVLNRHAISPDDAVSVSIDEGSTTVRYWCRDDAGRRFVVMGVPAHGLSTIPNR